MHQTCIITGRNEAVAKVIFLQVSVCPQGGGRVSASVHAGMPYPPRDGPPLDGGNPPRMENPPIGEPPQMEEHPPRWRTPPDGDPPRWRTSPGWRTPPDGEHTPPGSIL